jgi:hypothetical protein
VKSLCIRAMDAAVSVLAVCVTITYVTACSVMVYILTHQENREFVCWLLGVK